MRISRPAAALATTAVLILGGAAYGVHAFEDTAGAASGSNEVTGTARAFLSAWQAGDLDKAAQLTSNPRQAQAELRAYRHQTGVTSVTLTPEHAHGATLPFTATAHINYMGTKATWRYTSQLVVVRNPAAGEAPSPGTAP